MDYYRESEINRFTRIGAITLVIFALVGWYLRGLAYDRTEAADPQVSGSIAAEAPEEAPGSESIANRVRRWLDR